MELTTLRGIVEQDCDLMQERSIGGRVIVAVQNDKNDKYYVVEYSRRISPEKIPYWQHCSLCDTEDIEDMNMIFDQCMERNQCVELNR